MTQQTTDRDIRLASPPPIQPAFKPVALPALAAAVQASRMQASRPQKRELPPILRKEAVLG